MMQRLPTRPNLGGIPPNAMTRGYPNVRRRVNPTAEITKESVETQLSIEGIVETV